MSRENLKILKRVLAAAATLVVVLAPNASTGAAAVTPFREEAVVEGALYIGSDGVRFAWATNEQNEVVRVFDTLRNRNFELTAPGPGCGFEAIGRGIALWSCFPPETKLLTSLSTGLSRKPVGIEPIEREAAEPGVSCSAGEIGRYWLRYSCRGLFGPGGDTYWLNHRTGRITGGVELEDELFSPDAPFVDLDYPDLFRTYCTPLGWPHYYQPPYLEYAPPLAVVAYLGTGSDSIRLRRCGKKRAETLGRCLRRVCRSPQLGSRYVTWGEDRRVYAYLPTIKHRVVVGRSPAYFLTVAHTCDQIFALSPRINTVYAARFEPTRGAPPCQSKP
jgi:hypothetical protein